MGGERDRAGQRHHRRIPAGNGTPVLLMVLVALLALTGNDALAARRALIQVGGLNQWVDLSYAYSNQESESGGGGASSTQHEFQESYHFDVGYAIYHRRLINGRIGADLGLEQEFAESSVSPSSRAVRTLFGYQFDFNLLDRSKTPVNFFSRSDFSFQQRTLARSYTLRTDSLGASGRYQNRYLPVAISYQESSSETSGLESDRRDRSSTITMTASHTVGAWSNAGLSLSHSSLASGSTGGAEFTTDKETLLFTNTLKLTGGERDRRLYTSYRLEQESGVRDSVSSLLNESLSWELGKALRADLSYQNGYTRNDRNWTRSQGGEARLQHRLFESLTTGIAAQGVDTRLNEGYNRSLAGNLTVGYSKRLPQRSVLSLGYGYSYGVTDRNLQSGLGTVVNERLTVPPPPIREVLLQNPDVVAGSVVVRNGANPAILYQEGRDYLLDLVGRQTRLTVLEQGRIVIDNAAELLVDYQFLAPSRQKFATTAYNISGGLGLFDSRYVLSASFSESRRELLAGTADVDLSGSRIYTAAADAFLGDTSYGANYSRRESSLLGQHLLEGHWRHRVRAAAYSLFMQATDRLTVTDDRQLGGTVVKGRTENTFSTMANLRRPIGAYTVLDLRGTYLNANGGATTRNELIFDANLSTYIGLTELTIFTELAWRFQEDTTSRSAVVRVQARRYF